MFNQAIDAKRLLWRDAIKFLFLVSLFFLSGCDSHKAERNTATQKLNELSADFSSNETLINNINAKQGSLKAEYQKVTDQLAAEKNIIKESEDKLAEYLLDHKVMTLALGLTIGGLEAASSNSSTDSQKSGGTVATVVGGVYCLANSDECADVVSKGAYYGSAIQTAKKNIVSLDALLTQDENAYAELVSQKAPLLTIRNEMQIKIDSIKRDIESLACNSIVCL